MRILLVADIHANWPALQAIQEPWDVCFCLGDVVEYGLEPGPCVDWVRRHATHAVRGNHDHGTVQQVSVAARSGGFKYLTGLTRALTRERLSADNLNFLGRLPATRMVTLEDTRYLLVHATPRDPLDEYAPADPDFWARRLQRIDADVVCVGHTHQPYVLRVGDKLVINPGSVGQPRDGDPRAAYALIENYQVDLKRLEYPVEAAIQPIRDSSLPEQAKDMLIDVLRHGGRKNGT